MSILNTKDIFAFAKLINTTVETPSGEYSTAGTVTKINEDIEYVDSGGTEKTAEVALDGGTTCTASYNGIIVAEGDRVVVTIKNNVATITENYTNPNGNTIISGQAISEEIDFTELQQANTFYGIVDFSVPELGEGYKLIGIKGIKMQTYSFKDGKWSWYDIHDNNTAFFNLAQFNIDGSTITLSYNTTNSSFASGRHRVVLTYVAILSSAYTDSSKEENNG